MMAKARHDIRSPPPVEATSEADAAHFSLAYRMSTPVWVFDIDTARVLFANQAACALWQAEDEVTLRSRDFSVDMSKTVERRLRQYQADFEELDSVFNELWTLYPNGEPRGTMVKFRGFPLSNGRTAMQCEALVEADDTPENLRSAEALLHTDVVISLFQKNGPPLYLNPAARNSFPPHLTRLEMIFADQSDYFGLLAELDRTGEHRLVTRILTSHGQRWFDVSAKSCLDAATGHPALLLTAIDVSELKEARDRARHLADRDQLTNLHNRAYLQNHIAALAEQVSGGECGIVLFDIDRFKGINDRHGHEAGDCVLKEIATRVRSSFGDDCLAARLGGDEFVVLIENFGSPAQLDQLVATFRRAIAAPITHDKTRFEVSVSIGIAVFSPQTADFDAVLRQADIALYASKQAGRNRVTYFTPEMGVAAAAREKLEIELKAAVQNNEFVLHYQPRLEIASGRICGVEGLVRWNHPTKGVVMPDVFIPICEETGLIEELGRIVLRLGCMQAIAWKRAGLDLAVSVNVSPRQFGDPGLLKTLADLSEQPDFPRGKIELEITENVLIGDDDLIAEKLRVITGMGYRIAIDDFGTGYSNLSYISRFPLNCLKIDRIFINQLPESGPIIRLILMLGQQVGAKVVCEGVETEGQLAWLEENACDQAQGYFITRPLAPAQLMDFLGTDTEDWGLASRDAG